MQEYYLRAPESAIQYLKEKLPEDVFRKHHQKFLYFISNLHHEVVYNKTIQDDDFINRKMQYIRRMIGNYRIKFTGSKNLGDYIVAFWRSSGFVECDRHHLIGEKSLGYRLHPKLLTEKFASYQIKDKTLCKHIHDFLSSAYDKSLKYLCASEMNLKSLKINFGGALRFLDENYQDQPENYFSYLNIIEDIQEENFHFSRSKNNNRVHSTLTNLPRVLRQFLYLPYETEPLVSIDISNSQPFFFNFLIDDFCKEQGLEKDELSDLMEYYQLTSGGKFYEKIAAQMGIDLTEENRKEFKEEIFGNLFYNEIDVNNRYQLAFDQFFPNCYSILNYYKDLYGNKGLAVQMQRIEAKVWLDQVSRILYEQNKSIFFVTIHDSVIVQQKDVETVKKIIQQVFDSYNYQFNVKVEFFSTQTAEAISHAEKIVHSHGCDSNETFQKNGINVDFREMEHEMDITYENSEEEGMSDIGDLYDESDDESYYDEDRYEGFTKDGYDYYIKCMMKD